MQWHETIPLPPGTPPPPDASAAQVVDAYVGSAMYEVIEEHQLALLMALALPLVVWGLRRWRPHRLTRLDALQPLERMLAWILVLSATIHAGLALGHEPSGFSLLYIGGTIAPWLALRRMLAGEPWKRTVRLVLLGLTIGYAVVSFSEPPDSFGLATKLLELTGLAIALRPAVETRWRAMGASVGTFLVAIVVSLGGWVGAMSAGDGGHHLGATPPPGVLLPPGEDRPPTAAERAAAEVLYHETAHSLERFADPAAAAAAGYQVDGMSAFEGHADNPAYQHDGRVLDPDHPETLVYSRAASGEWVLLGAMYQTDEIGDVGPAVGGPLTVWHAHDHVCISLPIGLSGLTSPFGLCPLGSITIPVTNEMLHVWTLPGLDAGEVFGDIDEERLAAYLAER